MCYRSDFNLEEAMLAAAMNGEGDLQATVSLLDCINRSTTISTQLVKDYSQVEDPAKQKELTGSVLIRISEFLDDHVQNFNPNGEAFTKLVEDLQGLLGVQQLNPKDQTMLKEYFAAQHANPGVQMMLSEVQSHK